MNRSWMLVVATALGCIAVESAEGEEASTGAVEVVTCTDGDAIGPIDLGCDDPQPRLQLDGVTPSGFVECSDGFVHRAEAVACIVPEAGNCDTCGDCSSEPFGRCMSVPGYGGQCECVGSCETDADCSNGRVCACTGVVGDVPRCVPAGCTTSADCGEGLCGIGGSASCEFDSRMACLLPTAECRRSNCNDDGNCSCQPSSGGGYCCVDQCDAGCG
jgi:hypothetical protein